MRVHEPKICVKCGNEYVPTSGPQKFCLNCKPPSCEGCERIELAVEVERRAVNDLVTNTHNFLKLVPCISRTVYPDQCIECKNVCEWYIAMVDVTEILGKYSRNKKDG